MGGRSRRGQIWQIEGEYFRNLCVYKRRFEVNSVKFQLLHTQLAGSDFYKD